MLDPVLRLQDVLQGSRHEDTREWRDMHAGEGIRTRRGRAPEVLVRQHDGKHRKGNVNRPEGR